MVLADPTQIHQVLINLCTNAAHAMHERGGLLHVSLTEVEPDADFLSRQSDMHPGPYLKLTVKDTGYGMETVLMERIFDPYFTTKQPGEGTGLGLAVVHGIVKGHGGAITVHSEPGKGTTFHVFLPVLEKPTSSVSKSETGAPEPLPGGCECILFVDDEEGLGKSTSEMLRQLGYIVAARNSGIEALEAFRAQPNRFDLVITDLTMPKMTGTELARMLLQLRPDIPVILCTGFSQTMTHERASSMGIRELVMKPILIHELAATIRRVLDAGAR
jgi:two-component system, cell cycle sensor histidine kinase and response regulator CckA